MTEKIKTPYGTATIYRRKASKPKACIMVIPGFGESLSHNRELVDILARKGYDAFTYRQPRRKAVKGSGVIGRNKQIILAILAASTFRRDKIYAVAHSFGSTSLLRAALKEPELFSGILLMQPSGITGDQDFLELVRRTSTKITKNALATLRDRHGHRIRRKKIQTSATRPHSATTRKFIRSQLSSAFLIAKNPRLALHEALVAIRHDIFNDIKAVRDLGLPVYITVARGDELFDTEGDSIERRDIAEFTGTYLSILDKEAPHDTFWIHAERTADKIEAIVQQIERANTLPPR